MDSRVLTVDPKGTGEYKSINDAIRAAVDGDSIMLRIGLYEEKVVMDKAVNLVVDPAAEPGDVIINSGVISTAPGGCIRGIHIQQQIDIRGGNITIEECDISRGSDCIRVCTNADPVIRRCRIHDAQSGGDGIYFQEGAKGTVTECDIFAHRVNGIHVKGGDVILKGNKVHDSAYGIYFRKGGRGVVEGNTIESISCFGVYITTGSDPVVAKNSVVSSSIHGIMISQAGAGNIVDNAVHSNVRILKGCAPTLGINSFTGRVDNENTLMA